MDNTSSQHHLNVEQSVSSSDRDNSSSVYQGLGTGDTGDTMDTFSRDDMLIPDSEPSAGATIRSAVKELLETAIYILLVFVIVRSMVQNFKIEGSSMEPSMHGDQYILVNKLVYFHFDLNAPMRLLPGFEDQSKRDIYPLGIPKRGDIVVFEYPNDPRKDYIKRVIGLPGDTLSIRDGKVYLNGDMLDEPYLTNEEKPVNNTFCNPSNTCYRETITVPEGTVFVMGDNRGNSSDSREWNSLALEHIIGKAWLLYYPLDELSLIPHTPDPNT